jgi:hypothetical protein
MENNPQDIRAAVRSYRLPSTLTHESSAGNCAPPEECNHVLGECLTQDGEVVWQYRPLKDGMWKKWCLANCKKCNTTKSTNVAMVSEREVSEQYRKLWRS